MLSRTRSFRGFTLIELLVVMVVIAVLVAILLPAVQAARESARRGQCRNNIKQIVQALHDYHQKYRRFPSGWIGVTNLQHDVNGMSGFAWGAMILPQLEQNNVMEKINFEERVSSPANSVGRGQVINTFICPSDFPSVTAVWNIDLEPPKVNPDLPTFLPLANYVGCYGNTDLHQCEDDPVGSQCVGNGCFYLNSSVKLDTINSKDGTSTTLLIGERKTDEKQTPKWYSTWIGAAPGGVEAFARVLGTTDHRPNSTEHIEDFSSAHGEGIHAGIADGAVRFLANDIDPTIYKGLGSIDGNEVITDF